MANLNAQTTFTHSVQGNTRVMYADVSGTATSTADTVIFPLSFIMGAEFEGFRLAAAGTSAVPTLSVSGTTVNIFMPASSTGISYTIAARGR